MIAKLTLNLEKFNYNVIIANMYETYNYLISYIKNNKNIKSLDINYKKLLICFSPVIPHFVNECLHDLKISEDLSWPEYDESLLESDEISYVIQINGKKRAIIKAERDIGERDLLEILKRDSILKKYFSKSEIKKIIFVKNRLMNLLINE